MRPIKTTASGKGIDQINDSSFENLKSTSFLLSVSEGLMKMS